MNQEEQLLSFSADKARLLVQKAKDTYRLDALRKIEFAALSGETSVSIHCNNYDERKELDKFLTDLGYHCAYDKLLDLYVSWVE